MLSALRDYAVRQGLTLPPGYVNKPVKAYISLSGDGRLIGIDMTDGESVPCPDIGSMANSAEKSNVLVEKRSVVIPEEESVKSRFFLNALRDGAQEEPMLAVCANALEDGELAAQIREELDRCKVKPSDRIAFKVSNRSVVESERTRAWWAEYRLRFKKNEGGEQARCLITGECCTPVETVPKVSGLGVVGGHASGDALICFDKPAFCSYDLKQAANAPVSEEAFAAVKAALDDLLRRAPVLAGMKFVHWYDRPVAREEDELLKALAGFAADEDWEEEADAAAEDGGEEIAQKDAEVEQAKATALVQSVDSGEQVATLASEYHILLLTGVGGRVMIRRYERGSYQELQERLRLWQEDIALTNPSGTGLIRPHKLVAMLIRLMKRQKSDSRVMDRLGKELAGVTPAVLTAILTGAKLPDSVAARALMYIRSQLMETEGNGTGNAPKAPDEMACQWLKAWLCRREREKGEVYTLERCNENHPSAAYHCGRMVAVYADLQRSAMPGVNASIIERYYASAIQTPGLVIGRLDKMSRYYLEKLQRPGLAQWYKNMMTEIACAIGEKAPGVLTLEQQSEFTLGYYGQLAKMRSGKKKTAGANVAADEETEE